MQACRSPDWSLRWYGILPHGVSPSRSRQMMCLLRARTQGWCWSPILARQEAAAPAKDRPREPDPGAAWARPAGPARAARVERVREAAWEVQAPLKEREIRAGPQPAAAQARHGEAEEVRRGAEPVQAAVVLVQVERLADRGPAEEDAKIFYYASVVV